ncbi:MAG: peptidylprolyl isomerase [Planctomycetota bacterium]
MARTRPVAARAGLLLTIALAAIWAGAQADAQVGADEAGATTTTATGVPPEAVYDHLAPGTVLIKVNGLPLLSDDFITAALSQLSPADRNALIQPAQIAEELASRNIAIDDKEIEATANELAATYAAGLPGGQELNADQLTAVLGVDRTLFRRLVARFVGLRKLLVADGQIPAGTSFGDDAFKQASASYLKLLAIKYPARTGTGDDWMVVGKTGITREAAMLQYRNSVWTKGYSNAPAPDMASRGAAGHNAINRDVLSILDRILRYKVVYARWSSMQRIMTQEFRDQVLTDIEDTLAYERPTLGKGENMFEEFLRKRNQTREEFTESYEFEMTCMLTQLIADSLQEPVLKAEFARNPQVYGRGDPIVRMIFVPTQDDDGRGLPKLEATGLSSVDDAYEATRKAASGKARETLRVAQNAVENEGFLAAAAKYNQDPATRADDGLIGKVPPDTKDPRFTPEMMAEIKRLSHLPPKSAGQPVEGKDGWYLFQVDGIENPTFDSVRRHVFLRVLGSARVKLQDRLMHDATLEGLLAPAYRAFLDAEWKAKYPTDADAELPAQRDAPDAPAGGPVTSPNGANGGGAAGANPEAAP